MYDGRGRVGVGICGSEGSLITLGWVGSFFFCSESENIYLCMTLDSYASFAILFYVFGGSSYPSRVSEDVT